MTFCQSSLDHTVDHGALPQLPLTGAKGSEQFVQTDWDAESPRCSELNLNSCFPAPVSCFFRLKILLSTSTFQELKIRLDPPTALTMKSYLFTLLPLLAMATTAFATPFGTEDSKLAELRKRACIEEVDKRSDLTAEELKWKRCLCNGSGANDCLR